MDKTHEKGGWKNTVLHNLDRAADKGARPFASVTKELESYQSAQHDTTSPNETRDTEYSFEVAVRKTAQAVRVYSSYLFQSNPEFRVKPTSWAPPDTWPRSQSGEAYLNAIRNESDLEDELRTTVIDSIVGMGVMWHGVDGKKKIPISVHDSYRNLQIDPNATCLRDAKWIRRKRFKSQWWLLKTYGKTPELRKKIKAMDTRARPTDTDDVAASGRQHRDEDDGSEGIVFYEWYFKHGLHNYRGFQAEREDDAPQEGKVRVDDKPVFFVTAQDEVLHEGDWPIPAFHEDDTWPCSILSYQARPNSPYPTPILEAGLGFQRIINYAVSSFTKQYKWTNRKLIVNVTVGGKGIDEEQLESALMKDDDVIVIDVPLPEDGSNHLGVEQLMKDISFKADINSFEHFISIMTQLFEDHTGLTALLLSGQPMTQDRSAEASRLRREATMSSINDMTGVFEKFLSDVGRKQMIVAATMLDRDDDIRPFIGGLADAWPVIVPEGEQDGMAMLMRLIEGGADQARAMEEVLSLSGSMVSVSQFLREANYTVEAGSYRRKNPQQQLDALSEAMNQTVPTMLQSGDLNERAIAFDMIAEYHKEAGMAQPLLEALAQQANTLRQMAEQQQLMMQQQAMMPPPMSQPEQPNDGTL